MFFVSVSIDPETDTPALMKAQAEALRARPGWLFLTGKREDIDAIRYKLGERSRSSPSIATKSCSATTAPGMGARIGVRRPVAVRVFAAPDGPVAARR